MAQDIQFTWKPFKAYRAHYFTQFGAQCAVAIVFVLVIGSWNIVSMLVHATGSIPPKGLESYCAGKLLPGIIAAIFAGGGCFMILPKLENSETDILRDLRSSVFEYWFMTDHQGPLSKNPEVLTRTPEEIAAFLLQGSPNAEDKSPTWNVVTKAKLQVEDSPGNFTVEKQDDQVILRVYDRMGRPLVYTMPTQAE